MTTIYLVRHAEAEGNLYRRIHGWYNALITENGYLQMKCLEERFRDIPVDVVWSSDLYRTMTTARAVYVPKGLALHTDPQLRELNFGAWEDRTWGEVYREEPEQIALFNATSPEWRAPEGENLAEAGARLQGAITRVARENPDKTVAIFSHGTAIRQFLANVQGLSPQEWKSLSHSENTAVTCLEYEDGKFTVRFQNDASHLPQELTTLGKQVWWKKEGKARDVNLWYRPIQWQTERELYLKARHEAWVSTHGADVPFDGESFLAAAEQHLERTPWGVTLAMADEDVVGVLELDVERYAPDNAGYIAFCYMDPSRREQNLGVQLIGQAVAFYRPMGRDKLRLRCAPYNDRAQRFYQKYGFAKIGDEVGGRVPLEILEKYIGYER